MTDNTSIPFAVADVAVLAATMKSTDWVRIVYDGTNLLVPGDLVTTVNGIDLVAARKSMLISYAANKRYLKETGGIVVSGVAIETDRESQAMINGAYAMAQANPNFTTQWKVNSTTFTTLTAAQITAIAIAVGTFIASCFSQEATTVAGINANTITTNAQIDQAFA